MAGITLPYENAYYIFEVSDIHVNVSNNMLDVTFRLYYTNGDITNKTYTVMRRGDQFDIYMNYNDYAAYYRMLCVDINLDPSIIPDDLPIQ